MLSLLLAFLAVSVPVIVTLGPDTAITIRNTLLGGRAAGIATGLGVSTGQLIWAFAATLGLVAVLVASEPLFLAIKYAGAAYLVVLGAQALWAALRRNLARTGAAPAAARRLAPGAAFRQGVISNLGNPKMAVFFASLLPQFVPPGDNLFLWLLGPGFAFSLMTCAWLALYAAVIRVRPTRRSGVVLLRENRREKASISSAQATARAAWSGCTTGAENITATASPTMRSSVPSCFSAIEVMPSM
jgi:threonine/homoserine/homoserine lactone efflux protein